MIDDTQLLSLSGLSPRDFKPIVSGPHLQVHENGSLSLLDARESDSGYYLCQATNGIGQGLSKVVKISVHGELTFMIVVSLMLSLLRFSCRTFQIEIHGRNS
jgi:hypothetical protein